MVSRVFSAGIDGINGYIVTVECLLSGGLPRLDVVGLPTGAVSEAGERVRAAAKSCSFDWPVSRLTVNLAPADTRKAGTAFDLPILLSILAAAGEINALPQDALFFGELSLSGELRPVRGALSMARKERSLPAERALCAERRSAPAEHRGQTPRGTRPLPRARVKNRSGTASLRLPREQYPREAFY